MASSDNNVTADTAFQRAAERAIPDFDSGKDGEEENSGVFTETLARIYIKQGKYQRAYEIISRLHQQHPDKNGYYVDQLRFLEKLMLNSKKK